MPRNKKDFSEKYNSAFATQLRKAFEDGKAAGLTQAKLAAELGVTAQAVSKWYNGENEPQLSILPKIADYFGTSVDWLLGKDIPKTPDITNRIICEKTGLSGAAVDNLTMMARTNGGDDFWSIALKYVSFLLETYPTSLVEPAINVSSYIDTCLSMKDYTNYILPSVSVSPKSNPFQLDEEDLDRLKVRTSAIDEIRKLKDICTAKRYYCEKAASTAISAFVDQSEKSFEENPPQRSWMVSQHNEKSQPEQE